MFRFVHFAAMKIHCDQSSDMEGQESPTKENISPGKCVSTSSVTSMGSGDGQESRSRSPSISIASNCSSSSHSQHPSMPRLEAIDALLVDTTIENSKSARNFLPVQNVDFSKALLSLYAPGKGAPRSFLNMLTSLLRLSKNSLPRFSLDSDSASKSSKLEPKKELLHSKNPHAYDGLRMLSKSKIIYRQSWSVAETVAEDLKATALNNPVCLLGWQILLLDGPKTYSGINHLV